MKTVSNTISQFYVSVGYIHQNLWLNVVSDEEEITSDIFCSHVVCFVIGNIKLKYQAKECINGMMFQINLNMRDCERGKRGGHSQNIGTLM